MVSKTRDSTIAKRRDDLFLEPSHVKISALLYEITERTKQLAEPRARLESDKRFQSRTTVASIPKASARIVELSKPRQPYQHPSKPIGYVSRGALHAVATQRIIELSRPKRKQKAKGKRTKKVYASKSSYFAKHAKKRQGREYRKYERRMKRRKLKRAKQRPPRRSDSDRTIIVVDLKSKNK
ncbi:uncharacterized protein LOC144471750 [Augochlora pura]